MDIKKEDTNNYAIVIGNGHFNSLGVARSLGEKGVPVIFINLSKNGGAQDSKYTIKTFHINNTEEICGTIDKIISEFGGKPVLFPCSDADALYLDKHYAELKEKTYCPNLNGKADFFMNKENMCALAKECGFNVPETENLKIIEENEARLKGFQLPFIIKPQKSIDGPKSDIMICRNESDIETAIDFFFDRSKKYDSILVQQFVEGKENIMVEYCGCKTKDHKGHLVGQLEKIREYPINRGSTSYAVIKKDTTYIEFEMLDKMLDLFDFEGLFDLELKVVDGLPYFMEINFRNGAPAYGFTVAGFNVPYVWFCEQIKTEIKTINEISEIKLICDREDLSHVLDRNITPFKWIRDIRTADTMMVFNKQDKKPFQKLYGILPTNILSFVRLTKQR